MKTPSSSRTLSILLVVALVLLAIFQHQRARTQPTPQEITWSVMGTIASLRVPGEHAAAVKPAQELAATAFDEVNRTMSVYRPDSEISRLNTQSTDVPLSPQTESLLRISTAMTHRTAGRFDATLHPVIRLWGFSGGETPATLPTEADIAAARAATGPDTIFIGEGFARRTNPDASFDPGGIAKGFAIDLAYERITAAFPGLPVLINLGGEMRVQGTAAPERPWRIGVQHPFEKHQTIGVVSLASGTAVATSGHYERYFEMDGTRYAHIIDPRTGRPVTGTAGVTVISPNAIEADVLSTTLFIAGIEEAASVLDLFPDTHAIIIPDEQPIRMYLSPGMHPYFSPMPPYQDAVFPLSTLSKP